LARRFGNRRERDKRVSQPPGLQLWAETDLLREDAFREFVEHMQEVIDALEAVVASILPVADSIRGEEDQKIVDEVNKQLEQIRMILVAVRDLSLGDAERVKVLGKLLEEVEELNRDTAGGWNDSRT
jgi:uncharacterized protein Yka (UPF0111/DUF47 family)